MNATEMGRRSDSLYYDNVSRRELCDRIAHLESDLEDAKDKNADVWGSLKDREMRLAFQIDDNAKLRELVEILMPMVMRSQRYCSYICDVREQCVSLANPVYGCIKRRNIMERADEVGIEVV